MIKHYKFPPILTLVHPQCTQGTLHGVQCVSFYSSILYKVHTQSRSFMQMYISQTNHPVVLTAWPLPCWPRTEDSSGSSAPGSLPLIPGDWGYRSRAPGPQPWLPGQLEPKPWPDEVLSWAFIPALGGVGDKASKAFANVPLKAGPVLPAVCVTGLMDGVGGGWGALAPR